MWPFKRNSRIEGKSFDWDAYYAAIASDASPKEIERKFKNFDFYSDNSTLENREASRKLADLKEKFNRAANSGAENRRVSISPNGERIEVGCSPEDSCFWKIVLIKRGGPLYPSGKAPLHSDGNEIKRVVNYQLAIEELIEKLVNNLNYSLKHNPLNLEKNLILSQPYRTKLQPFAQKSCGNGAREGSEESKTPEVDTFISQALDQFVNSPEPMKMSFDVEVMVEHAVLEEARLKKARAEAEAEAKRQREQEEREREQEKREKERLRLEAERKAQEKWRQKAEEERRAIEAERRKVEAERRAKETAQRMARIAQQEREEAARLEAIQNSKTVTNDEAMLGQAGNRAEAINLNEMSGYEFEEFCAELLKKNGFSKAEVTQGSGDQGVDVVAVRDGVKYAIQCKRYSGDVGNRAVQEVFAGRQYYGCHVAVIMTNSKFTPAAKGLAAKSGVVLWDGDKLKQMLKDVGSSV